MKLKMRFLKKQSENTDKIPVNLPFSKFVLPIDKKVFRIHILKCLSFQLLLVSIVYIILQNRDSNMDLLNTISDDYYIAWFANLLMLMFVYDINLFRARFKDIYPDQELNKIFYFFAGMIPVFFFGMVIFLCVKNSDSGDSYPRAFRKRYALLGLLPLLALQGQFPLVSFWTASSSSFYLVDTLNQSQKIAELKNTASIEEEFKKRPGMVTIMGLVWKASLDLHSAKNRTIASQHRPYVDSFKDGFKFLHTCHEAIIQSEDNSIRLTDYSPIQWLHPGAPVDILLTKVMEQSIREKTAMLLYYNCNNILEKLEWHYQDLRLKNEDYKKEMSDLRMKFSKTRSFVVYNTPIKER